MTKSTAYAWATRLRARGWPTRVTHDRGDVTWGLWIQYGPFIHLLWNSVDDAWLVSVRG